MDNIALTLKCPPGPGPRTKPTLRGRAKVGATLTCAPGGWTGKGIHFTYGWKRGRRVISGASHATYRLRKADRAQALSCVVVARNSFGASSATSLGVKVRR